MSPHPNILCIENSLLVVIDIQSKLLSAMTENTAEQMLKKSSILLKAAKLLNIPVIVTEQYPQGLGSTDLSIIESLAENTAILDKTGFCCFSAEGFSQALENSGRKQIILIGQEAHVCVLQTALTLLHKGYQVHIVEDAICSRSTEHKLFALQRMQQQGASINNYESVIFEWLKDSKHADFKSISRLLR